MVYIVYKLIIIKMKKIFLSLLASLILSSCTGLTKVEEGPKIEEENKKINITTSIIPLASISNYIGWDYVNASSLVPVWVSSHWYDMKANQMVQIQDSDLIVYLWLDHIDWFLEKALNEDNKYIKVAEWITLIEWEEHNHEHEDENHNEEHEDEHGHEDEHEDENHDEESHTIDPHVWTSSKNAILIAEKITNELVSIDYKNADYYKSNLDNFTNELNTIKNDFIKKNNNLNQKEFIIFHDAYNYLFEELSIKQENKLIFQSNVLSDPNSKEMKELVDEINLHWINIAYKEPQLNDSNLQMLANEYNIRVEVLNPLWDDESKDWYINNYKNNLQNLEYIYE